MAASQSLKRHCLCRAGTIDGHEGLECAGVMTCVFQFGAFHVDGGKLGCGANLKRIPKTHVQNAFYIVMTSEHVQSTPRRRRRKLDRWLKSAVQCSARTYVRHAQLNHFRLILSLIGRPGSKLRGDPPPFQPFVRRAPSLTPLLPPPPPYLTNAFRS
jgi:hypothetical protein